MAAYILEREVDEDQRDRKRLFESGRQTDFEMTLEALIGCQAQAVSSRGKIVLRTYPSRDLGSYGRVSVEKASRSS